MSEIKTGAPKGVADKALWNKIEKSVKENGKYKKNRLYKVVQKAYQDAGGTYTHKDKVKNSSAIQELIALGEKIEAKYIK